jgi:hypothetical protein
MLGEQLQRVGEVVSHYELRREGDGQRQEQKNTSKNIFKTTY